MLNINYIDYTIPEDRITCLYTCKNEVCDFEECLKKIRNERNGEKYEKILKIIESNQNIYLPWKVDGFCFKNENFPLFYIKRDYKGIVGFVSTSAK